VVAAKQSAKYQEGWALKRLSATHLETCEAPIFEWWLAQKRHFASRARQQRALAGLKSFCRFKLALSFKLWKAGVNLIKICKGKKLSNLGSTTVGLRIFGSMNCAGKKNRAYQ